MSIASRFEPAALREYRRCRKTGIALNSKIIDAMLDESILH